MQSIGTLYYLSGILLAILALVFLGHGVHDTVSGIVAVVYGLLAALSFWVGWCLRRLDPRGRLPVGILSGIGLLGVPIGTLINGYILYLVFSKKGKMVFLREYREIILQTPHIKYKTSLVVIVLLVALIALFALAILVPLLSRLVR